MAEVAALDEVEVIAHVVEQYVPHIRVGMQVSVEVPALPGRRIRRRRVARSFRRPTCRPAHFR